jgi:hypothetical protein
MEKGVRPPDFSKQLAASPDSTGPSVQLMLEAFFFGVERET